MEIRAGTRNLTIILPGHETPAGEPDDGGQAITMSWDALASWQTLLGIESVGETIAVMLESATNPEPETIDENGRNPWTISYEALEASLNDTVPDTLSLDSSEAHLNDPLTVARNQTLTALGATTRNYALKQHARYALKQHARTAQTDGLDIHAINQRMQDNALADRLEQAQGRFFESLMPQQHPQQEQ
jgi:hypothetical protein